MPIAHDDALIRLARPDDADGVLEIYAPIVRESHTSFEYTVPTVDAMRDRMATYLAHAPWLVMERGGSIVGYAYASKHRDRDAYQWAVEVSVYVHRDARRGGVARVLYTTLFDALVRQGFYNAYAGVTLPNEASVAFHESVGFRPIGVYRNAGFKAGRWYDVGWWQRDLRDDRAVPPLPPRRVRDVVLEMGL